MFKLSCIILLGSMHAFQALGIRTVLVDEFKAQLSRVHGRRK